VTKLEQGKAYVCRVKKLFPHSASVEILELGIEGIIPVREVAKKLVRDIRHHLREGDLVVAKVIKLGEMPMLSIRLVEKEEKLKKLHEYELEKRAKNLLEHVARVVKERRKLPKVVEKVKEVYGSLYACLEHVHRGKKAALELFPESWRAELLEEVKKLFRKKEHEFKALIELQTLEPDGIERIKSVLLKAKELGLKVHYISAPRYELRWVTRDPKRGEKVFKENVSKVVEHAKSAKCFKSLRFHEQ